MVSHLIHYLLDYKSKMPDRSLDFDVEKQIQCQELRVELAAKLYVDDESMFPFVFEFRTITRPQDLSAFSHLGNRAETSHMNLTQNSSR